MKNILRCLLLLLANSAYSEEASQSGPGISDEAFKQSSAVSTAREGFALEQGATFGWRENIILAQDVNISSDNGFLVDDVKFIIETELSKLGMVFVDPMDSRYAIVAAVLIGDSDEGKALSDLTKLYPTLGAVEEHETGTLLIGISRPGNSILLWRGAIQVFLAGEHYSNDEKLARFQPLVQDLMSTIPLQPKN